MVWMDTLARVLRSLLESSVSLEVQGDTNILFYSMQDGMLKFKGTYEILSPEDIGLARMDASGIVLGKHRYTPVSIFIGQILSKFLCHSWLNKVCGFLCLSGRHALKSRLHQVCIFMSLIFWISKVCLIISKLFYDIDCASKWSIIFVHWFRVFWEFTMCVLHSEWSNDNIRMHL